MPTLTKKEIDKFLTETPSWSLTSRENIFRIERTFEFPNFVDAMSFVNRVAEIAEKEGHHPDLHIHYNKVRVEIWTHKINGLHENDFILASKIGRFIQAEK